MNVYSGADRAIKLMNRRNMKAFDTLRLMKADELNIMRKVGKVYRDSARFARTMYYEIAVEAYIVALVQAHVTNGDATEAAERDITLDWIDEMLEETDFVTLYQFDTETVRKAQRLAEALEAVERRNDEIDKALRWWTLQVGQYAINTVDRARLEAFRRAGIKKVRWNTKKDERVCDYCGPLDGKVFDIEDVPPKPHLNCRCTIGPVFDEETDQSMD